MPTSNTQDNKMGGVPHDFAHCKINTMPESASSVCERCNNNEPKSSIRHWNHPILTYGLILLLFLWNVESWSQVRMLRSEMRELKLKMEDSQLDYHVPSHPPTQVKAKRTTDDHLQSNVLESMRKALRVKRSSMKEGTGSSEISHSGEILQKMRRSVRKSKGKSEKRKRKRPDRTQKRRSKGKNMDGSSVSPMRTLDTQATAIHVMIGGRAPYRPTRLTGSDGIIRSWQTIGGRFRNQGFDVSKINATDNSVGVTIKKTGVYYIYGQVAFGLGSGIDYNSKIEIGMPPRMRELASCLNYPANRRNGDVLTCHSSGIARMEKGWKFRLRIYPRYLTVYNHPDYTYFGAFLIGSAVN